MKNTNKLPGIIVLAAVIGLSIGLLMISACAGGGSSLNGTWVDADNGETLVLKNGSLTFLQDDVEWIKGKYTAKGSVQTVTVTQVSGALFGADALSMGLSTDQWYTQSQLRTTIIQAIVNAASGEMPQSDAADIQSYAEEMYDEDVEGFVNELFGATGSLTLNGETLGFTLGEETSTYIKQ